MKSIIYLIWHSYPAYNWKCTNPFSRRGCKVLRWFPLFPFLFCNLILWYKVNNTYTVIWHQYNNATYGTWFKDKRGRKKYCVHTHTQSICNKIRRKPSWQLQPAFCSWSRSQSWYSWLPAAAHSALPLPSASQLVVVLSLVGDSNFYSWRFGPLAVLTGSGWIFHGL